jgi:RNA polymerase sigma-70 factor (ECF subfamily)
MAKMAHRQEGESLLQESDEKLAVLAVTDQRAFGILVDRYQSKLLRFIRTISSVRHEEAEDILQEAFIKSYRNLNSFDEQQTFSAWIYRIVRNETISHYRKRSVRPEGHLDMQEEGALDQFAHHLNIAMEAEKAEEAAMLRKALDELDPKYRDVLILQYLEEKDYKEISDILHIPMGTVATRINRAKDRFKIIAKKYGLHYSYE